MVAQLIPLVLSDAVPASYQKPSVKIGAILSVSHAAPKSRIPIPNTPIKVARAQPNVA